MSWDFQNDGPFQVMRVWFEFNRPMDTSYLFGPADVQILINDTPWDYVEITWLNDTTAYAAQFGHVKPTTVKTSRTVKTPSLQSADGAIVTTWPLTLISEVAPLAPNSKKIEAYRKTGVLP